ncbi:MAG: substrate-binding domain-containing protein [Abitibacteriaceae bacterium]|nr:substrate-binding domain-containing protein [Abditibacteriaceae bacterium]
MKRFLWTALSTGAISGAMLLAGCGSSGTDNSTTNSTTTTAQSSTTTTTSNGATDNASSSTNASTGAGAGGGKLRVEVIPKGLTHVYWQAVKKGAEDAGKQFGADIIWNGPSEEGNGVQQEIQIVEDAVTKKVDGIVVAPIDRTALVPVIDKAAAAKIPLVIFDSDAQTKNRISFVATNNYHGGELAGERMGQITGGKGNVGMVPVQANSQSTEDREKGFEDTVKKKFPNIHVIRSQYGQSDRTISMNVAQDMLTGHPDIVAIFGPNETSAVGALNAVRNRQLTGKVKIVGFDSAPTLTEGLTKGDIDSLVVQNPYKMGFEGVKAIVDNKGGKKVEPRIDTGVKLITKANMNDPDSKKLLQ